MRLQVFNTSLTEFADVNHYRLTVYILVRFGTFAFAY